MTGTSVEATLELWACSLRDVKARIRSLFSQDRVADALRDMVRDYALETLADEDAVLVIDETEFLKQGKGACGVGCQYTGSASKITNCQIGVFAAYVSLVMLAFAILAAIRHHANAVPPPKTS